MNTPNLILKYSPFVFLKRLAIIELVIAFAPAILLIFPNLETAYNQAPIVRGFTFNVVWTLILTAFQIAIIAGVFFSWWWPSYVITKKEVFKHREGGIGVTPLANTYAIVTVEIHQGYLGKKLNYGTLIINTSDQSTPVHLTNIPEPLQNKRLIEDMVDISVSPQALPAANPPQELIAAGENQSVEFKSSLQWDYRQQKRNKDLHEPVMKNLVAYMNTVGGAVLIGVDDDGQILGLAPDYATMGKKNSDGFENNFNMAFNKMIGAEYRQYVDISFHTLQEKEICVLRTIPAADPVFLTHKGKEKFYIRTGNSSQPLTVSKASRYIQTRFQS